VEAVEVIPEDISDIILVTMELVLVLLAQDLQVEPVEAEDILMVHHIIWML
jgi:hypothetical protein